MPTVRCNPLPVTFSLGGRITIRVRDPFRGQDDKTDSVRLCHYAAKEADALKAAPALNPAIIRLKDLRSFRTRLLSQLGASINRRQCSCRWVYSNFARVPETRLLTMRTFFHKLFHSYKTKSVIFLAKSIAGSVQMGLRKLFTAKSQSSEPIVIVTLANDGFAMMLAVTLKSMLHNYRQQNPVYIYIMDQQISEANKEKVLQSVSDKRVTIEWVLLDDAFFDRHRLRERYAHLPTTYYRFFLPLFVAEQYKKIIWLDGDLVVRKDISELWNIPMEGNYALAVQDTRIPYIGDTIRNYAALGMAPGAQYFNAGVVVIDMEQWRAEDLSNKIMQCIEDNQKDLLYHDQYGLNVVLYKKWKSINPNWNIFPEFYPSLPYIIHYVSVKPTSTAYVNYNRHFFYRYLDMTVWKGWRPA